MNFKKALVLIGCVLFAVPCFAQGNRGKAELKAGSGSITIEYGRPSLKGRDMLSNLKVGDFWRLGMNQATVISTPVDLIFGSTKVDKGSYSLFLKRSAEDKYELVFNSQTGQWGTQHDQSKDICQIPLEKESLSSPNEEFTIELKDAPKGGMLELSWGNTKLMANLQFAR